MRRYHNRRRRGAFTTETAEGANGIASWREITNGANITAKTYRAVLAVQYRYRWYVSTGCAGGYGIALLVLLSRWQSQKMAYGEPFTGA